MPIGPASSATASRACARPARNAPICARGSGSGSTAASIARHSAGGQVAPDALQRRQARADAARGRRRVVRADRVDPREALVEDDAERVDIRRAGRAPARGLLGRHVGERPHDVAGLREDVAAGHQRDAEVRELRDPGAVLVAVGADDVRRLDVTVHDAARMRVLERVAERHPDQDDIAVGEVAAGEQLGERAPADELGHEVDRVLVAAGLVQRDDPGVRQARRRERLALAALLAVELDRDPLDGDVALEVLVAREVHDAHPPGADPPHEVIAAKDDLARVSGMCGRVGVRHRLGIRRAQRRLLARRGRKPAPGRKVALSPS